MKRPALLRIGFWGMTLLIWAVLVIPRMPWNVQASQDVDQTSTVARVLQIEYEGQADLIQLNATLDVWEVHPEQGYLVALVEQTQQRWLDSSGYRYQVDTRYLVHPDTIPGYACYRTVTELYADLQQVANNHPAITRLSTIGYSYEGRAIQVLRITNFANQTTKPKLFLMANIHGRELITPETAMVFIDYLVDNYGSDPDVTWVVDHHELHIVVSTNPDGHVKNEPGQPWSWWRKNTNPSNGCGTGKYGVDLNRNHSYAWGCCAGSSGDPCSDTYRGPSAASEVETQIIQNYVRSIFPDQRGDGDAAAAPEDATGVLITLHSYSNLVLWPWGHVSTPAPNAAGLEALGRKMATYNLYAPGPSYTLYPTDGTTDEFSYGELGIASYTYEIGSGSDGFYPSCDRYDALIQPNLPALFYAAKVVRTPYLTARGPDALSLATDPAFVISGQQIKLTAVINDTKNGNHAIKAAEYYIDTPPWAGGIAHPMSAVDGLFNAPLEAVTAQVATAGLVDGRHTIFLRGQDINGYWGPLTAIFIDVRADSAVAGMVTRSGDAAPVAGAELAFETAGYAYTAVSDELGLYLAPLVSGTYTLTASAFGYLPETFRGIVATTAVTTTYDIALQALPAGQLSGVVAELGSNLPLMGAVLVQPSNQLVPVDAQGFFEIELPQGSYTLTASASAHYSRTLSAVYVTGGEPTWVEFYLPAPACVLLVNDAYLNSTTPDYEAFYSGVLQNERIQFEQWNVFNQGTPSAETLLRYPVVLWYTGNVRYGTLNVGEQGALRSYLNNGGALLLSGQNIAEDIAADAGNFLGTTLHTNYVSGNSVQSQLTGAGVYAGLAAALNGGDSANNQTNPDEIALVTGSASLAFTYGDGVGAGVAADPGAYRSIFLAFGVEGLQTAWQRTQTLTTGLEWLGCSAAGIDLQMSQQVSSRFALPGQLLIYTIELFNRSPVPLTGLSVVDLLPAELSLSATSPTAQVSGRQLTWQNLYLPPEGSLTLQISARIQQDVPLGIFIHNSDITIDADQFAQSLPGPGAGTFVSETLPHQIYIPFTR